MFCISETLCFDVSSMLILGVFLLFLFGGLGYLAFRHFFPSDDGEGIRTISVNFEQSVPEQEDGADAEADGVDEDEYAYRPFAIGTKFFGGEFLGLGVSLELLEYDDDEEEMIFRLWVETPISSTDIVIDHDMDTEYTLGTATVRFQLNGAAQTVLINMGSDELEDCDYSVVILAHQSTNEDIKE